MPGHHYTPEQVVFLETNIAGRSYAEITGLFNARFGTDLRISQITGALKNRGLCNGRDTRIKPGSMPHNKGKPGNAGWKSTQFKAGRMPWNYKPVGAERINRDGYVEIKIADPKTWRAKHVILWEQANGPVPKGHAVIFGDGNRSNFEPDNLILISRRELAVANKMGLIQNDAELTRAGIVIADIYLKIGERKKALGPKGGRTKCATPSSH